MEFNAGAVAPDRPYSSGYLFSDEFIRDRSWNGYERNRLLVNLGEGQFVEAATAYGLDSLRDGRGLAIADFDGDGGLDLIVNNYNAPAHYFVNHLPHRGHWLAVRLRGRQSNRDGIGAIIRVRTGERRQMRVITAGDGYASQYSRVAHFGLAEATVIDELEVTWPDGMHHRQAFRQVPSDCTIEIDQGSAQLIVTDHR